MLTHWVHYVDALGKKISRLFSSLGPPINLSPDLSIEITIILILFREHRGS